MPISSWRSARAWRTPGGRLQAQILQVRRQLELLGLLPAASPMPAIDDGPLIRALAIR